MKHSNEINTMHIAKKRGVIPLLGWLTLLASMVLAGCGGGASTSSQTPQAGPNPLGSGQVIFNSSGGSDLDRFRNNLWANINASNRCGNCHTAGGLASSHPFANINDLQASYETITLGDPSSSNRYVNRTNPEASGIVTKVASGHNCWLASPADCGTQLTTWIRSWVQPTGQTGTTVTLSAPVDEAIGGAKVFPPPTPGTYAGVHSLLTQYCSNCHVPNVRQSQQPFFAVSDMTASYNAVVSNAKINLVNPSDSRLYRRLVDDRHNCWSDCASNGATMLTAITNFTNSVTATAQEAGTVVSRVVDLSDGISVSIGSRIDTNAVAVYEFKEGSGGTITDTSGVGSPTNLVLSGVEGTDYQWLPNWGIRFLTSAGHAQATNSSKIYNGILSTNAYTIEAWITPSNVTQQNANIVSFSASNTERNVAMVQYEGKYRAYNRSTNPTLSAGQQVAGEPFLATADDDALATLQHVVITYSAAAGRRIYVNGRYTEDTDTVAGASLQNWLLGGGYQLMFGAEGGARPWAGALRKVVIHNAALTATEIQQNFSASVGQKYILMFNVSGVGGFPTGSYIHMQVEEFDGYSYLFYKPTFVMLDTSQTFPEGLQVRGIRVGLNGREATIGQAFAGVSATLTNAAYVPGSGPDSGTVLSYLGAVIPKELGTTIDKFFLSFEVIGAQTATKDYYPVVANTTPPALTPPTVSDVMIHTFEEINASMATMTGIARTATGPQTTYNTVYQQLPPVEGIDGFLPSHQMAVTQLAIAYCNELVNNTTARASYFPGVNFGGMSFSSAANRDLLVNPLLVRTLNDGSTDLASQPDPALVGAELHSLINLLAGSCSGGNCNATQTQSIAKATCAAAIAGAPMLLQ